MHCMQPNNQKFKITKQRTTSLAPFDGILVEKVTQQHLK